MASYCNVTGTTKRCVRLFFLQKVFFSFKILRLRVGGLENKRRQFWFCCHMLSGNCQARQDANTMQILDRLTITRQHMTVKPKLSSFILFLMHSGGKFREAIDPTNLK